MSAVEPPLPLPDRLRNALADAGLSQRELARRIVARTDGPDASGRRVENERRQIGKYLAGQHAPEPERAALIAELLGKPSGYFIDDAETKTRLIDQMRVLVDLVDRLATKIDERIPEREPAPLDLAEEIFRRRRAGEPVPQNEADAVAALLEEAAALSVSLAAQLRRDDAAEHL